MNVARLILGSLFLVACSGASTAAPSVAYPDGSEEPTCSCSWRSPEERARALALEWEVMQLVGETVRDRPSDADAATVFIATASRIMVYEDHDSACILAGVLSSYATGCGGGPRTVHDGLLPDLVVRADEICSDHEPRAPTTLAFLRGCDLAP